MGPDRVFFPQHTLDVWLAAGRAEVRGNQLNLVGEGRRYRIIEAVFVQREVSGCPDTFELVDKVKSLLFVTELGAELLGGSMVIGDNAYDVVTGFLGLPMGPESPGASSDPVNRDLESEESLLARYQRLAE